MIIKDEAKGDRLRSDCINMVKDICSTLADRLGYFNNEGSVMGSIITSRLFHAHIKTCLQLIEEGYLPLNQEAFSDLDSELEADLLTIKELLNDSGVFKDD